MKITKIQIPQQFHFPPVFIAVLVSNESNINLSILSYKKWGKFLSLYSPESQLFFYSQQNIEFFNKKHILHIYQPTKEHRRPYSKGYMRIGGFIAAMNDFLNNSSALWFLRTTDTSFINLKTFSDYIAYLESIFTPDDNILMKGELKFIYNSFYLDGNAGFLMTREAVKFTVDMASNIKVFSDPMMNDDILISEYWEELPFDPLVYSSKAFLGTILSPKTSRRLHDNIYAGLPICPEGNQYSRVKDIAIWSSIDENYTALTYGNEILENIPDYVYFKVNTNGYTTLCVDADIPHPSWMDYEPYLN